MTKSGKVCFKIGAQNGQGDYKLSNESCNKERLNPKCFMSAQALQEKQFCDNLTSAIPLIRHRDHDTVTVAWNKVKNVVFYSVNTRSGGTWRQVETTKNHFYNLKVD